MNPIICVGMVAYFALFCAYIGSPVWGSAIFNLSGMLGLALAQSEIAEREARRVAALVAKKFEEAV